MVSLYLLQNNCLISYRIVIVSFLITCIYLFIYDCWQYLTFVGPKACQEELDTIITNNILWIVSRLVAHILWTVPLLVIFWPQLRKQNRSKYNNTTISADDSKGKSINARNTLDDEDMVKYMAGGLISQFQEPTYKGSYGNLLIVKKN